MPNSPFSGESHEHLLNRGSSGQTHLTASSVLTSHPAATTAACATVAKGVCMTVTIDKVAKKALSESEATAAKSIIKSNSASESKVIENK
ncbi:MAG: hypothetical protein K2Y14_04610 [Burkholderiales bacterium]|nr:hypothetical protein [Burkholderiales bacterium]